MTQNASSLETRQVRAGGALAGKAQTARAERCAATHGWRSASTAKRLPQGAKHLTRWRSKRVRKLSSEPTGETQRTVHSCIWSRGLTFDMRGGRNPQGFGRPLDGRVRPRPNCTGATAAAHFACVAGRSQEARKTTSARTAD
jgi:hypothetical protein